MTALTPQGHGCAAVGHLRLADSTGDRRAPRAGVPRDHRAGAALVVFWRAADPQASLRQLVDSTEPFDRWLAEAVAPLHPVPLATLIDTVSANRLIAQYPEPGRDER